MCHHFKFSYHLGNHIPSVKVDFACVVFWYVHTMVWLPALGIFSVHKDVNASLHVIEQGGGGWVGVWGALYEHHRRICTESWPWGGKIPLHHLGIGPASAACLRWLLANWSTSLLLLLCITVHGINLYNIMMREESSCTLLLLISCCSILINQLHNRLLNITSLHMTFAWYSLFLAGLFAWYVCVCVWMHVLMFLFFFFLFFFILAVFSSFVISFKVWIWCLFDLSTDVLPCRKTSPQTNVDR